MTNGRRGAAVVGLTVLLVLTLTGGLATVLAYDPPSRPAAAPAPVRPVAPPPGFMTAFTPPTAPKPAPAPRKPAAPGCTPSAAPVRPIAESVAATALGSSISVYSAPGAARPLRALPSPTRDFKTLVVGVVEDRGAWLLVRYNERPNGVTGWIRASEVRQERVEHHIVVERCARRLTLYESGRPVLQAPVGVGTPRTWTPLGDFYVDFVERRPNPRGSYGPYLISVSGFSEVYLRFGKGGVGQIAIHGTNKPSSVGKFSSNGCIRMLNATITEIAMRIRAGTPVTIVA